GSIARKYIYALRESGKSEVIAEVSPGEFFGEMALLEEMPRTATAYALEETRVFMLFKIKLESLLFSRPRIGVVIATQLAEIMSARLRAYIEKGA
ncbi:MAG TPA: cyclic nucleotide-binding domain-containing protein, partial [Elusimicrobiales bacterium]|nr:cyclic nucleotide-binding domain-containing protein [Elusimicrobiales bacterium]